MTSRTPLLLLLAGLGVLAPAAVDAQQVTVSHGAGADSSRIVPRLALDEARHAIVTRDGRTALLLTQRGIVLQLTDRGLREVADDEGRETKKEGVLAELLAGVVRGGVRALLDRGIEYPLSDLRDARYRDGRLSFIARDGGTVFQDVRINDVDVMEAFHPRDARGFVVRFREAKAGR
jgi:hypothetical protein